MRKGRFWYTIISFLLAIGLLVFSILSNTPYYIYIYIIIALLLVPNFTFRNAEKNQLIRIIGNYTVNCDAGVFYEELKSFYDSLYLTKKARKVNNIMLAMILVDMGKIDEARSMLEELSDIVDKLNHFNRYNYYRAWCNVYYEKGEAKHYMVLLDQMRIIVDNEKPSMVKDQMAMNFRYIEAKYFIMNGIYLDKARSIYEETLNNSTPLIMKLSANYYLGVISSKENQREKAIDYFKKVAFSGRKINLVNKATKYVEALEK